MAAPRAMPRYPSHRCDGRRGLGDQGSRGGNVCAGAGVRQGSSQTHHPRRLREDDPRRAGCVEERVPLVDLPSRSRRSQKRPPNRASNSSEMAVERNASSNPTTVSRADVFVECCVHREVHSESGRRSAWSSRSSVAGGCRETAWAQFQSPRPGSSGPTAGPRRTSMPAESRINQPCSTDAHARAPGRRLVRELCYCRTARLNGQPWIRAVIATPARGSNCLTTTAPPLQSTRSTVFAIPPDSGRACAIAHAGTAPRPRR
jgi:hypothetical protein